jgi:hypothetical protein
MANVPRTTSEVICEIATSMSRRLKNFHISYKFSLHYQSSVSQFFSIQNPISQKCLPPHQPNKSGSSPAALKVSVTSSPKPSSQLAKGL